MLLQKCCVFVFWLALAAAASDQSSVHSSTNGTTTTRTAESAVLVLETSSVITTSLSNLSTGEERNESYAMRASDDTTSLDAGEVLAVSESVAPDTTLAVGTSLDNNSRPQESGQILNPATADSVLSALNGNNNSELTNIFANESLGDEDSLNDQFLSFEEWKKAKGVGSDQQASDQHPYRATTKQSIAADAIGEEMEIDISNFFSPQEPEGKLYKDKFNFASFDCAATIVKTNSEAKGATSILFENKDSYLLNPCSAPNQFVIIELCQDILVDSVVMGNFEFFSSTFKKVRFSVSETFPVPTNGWKVLAEVTAKDIRDFQSFNISNPMIWAKYFRLEILEHYGTEYYCPLSVVRVHGRTMMQEYKQEEALQNSKADHAEVMETIRTPTTDVETEKCLQQKRDDPEVKCEDRSPATVGGALNSTIIDIDIDLMNNLTAWNDFDECAVTLPQLTLEQLFSDIRANTSCDPGDLTNTAINTPLPNINGGTQESIYKNIMKRLSALEANATLSVLYIEEQSKHISNAFNSLEKRHSKKLEGLMKTFNSTIHSQIEGLSNLYDLVQHRTDDIFNRQREQHEQQLKSSDSRLDGLASDLKFQRMINFINAVILFCLLLYIVLTRETYIETDWAEDGSTTPMSTVKQRVVSKSRIRANFDNFKRYYYNSDATSMKSMGPSDEDEVDSGHETPLSQETEFREPIITDNSLSTSDDASVPAITRPITPDNSDHE